ncbi:cellulose biosynthesis protein BcsO [Phytobacter sp. V91]|uniref:cellulose biosynthesis protein BcsO n=1 Tax=Phytobacter sp. V91 TaxID=3369425 RepID=UPI003F5D91D9
MNHYDDLQRFKDKTRNQQYNFKDFSAQNIDPDQGNWALINQLSPNSDEANLAMGGHVLLPSPQPVSPDIFAHSEAIPVVNNEITPDAPLISAAPVLRDVAHQLAAAPLPAEPVVHSAPQPAFSPPPAPVQPASHTPEPASYARLFAPKPADVKPTVEKNQSLQSLLERIASCR